MDNKEVIVGEQKVRHERMIEDFSENPDAWMKIEDVERDYVKNSDIIIGAVISRKDKAVGVQYLMNWFSKPLLQSATFGLMHKSMAQIDALEFAEYEKTKSGILTPEGIDKLNKEHGGIVQ